MEFMSHDEAGNYLSIEKCYENRRQVYIKLL